MNHRRKLEAGILAICPLRILLLGCPAKKSDHNRGEISSAQASVQAEFPFP